MKLRLGTWEEYVKQNPGPAKDDPRRYAMPWLSDTGNDFGLGDERTNRKKLELYLKNVSEVIEEDEEYQLFLSGSWKDGGYLIKQDKKRELIVYYCKFNVRASIKTFPHIVTQAEVWRTDDQPEGMAKKILFDILYKKYKAIMSDRIHTELGRRFWRGILALANRKSLGIAFVFNDQIIPKTLNFDLFDFFKEVDTWKSGPENKEKEMAKQFMIFDPEYLKGPSNDRT
jgi:hypothetical protein